MWRWGVSTAFEFAQSPRACARSKAAGFSNAVLGTGAIERMADHGGGIAEVVDAFGGFDVVEEFLVPHGVREVRERFGDSKGLGRT